jgi:hypothetical protein
LQDIPERSGTVVSGVFPGFFHSWPDGHEVTEDGKQENGKIELKNFVTLR